MFVITFPKHYICGGWGDRIVGLISVQMMAKALHRPFYIDWQKENIGLYFDYSSHNFSNVKLSSKDKEGDLFECIDDQKKYKQKWMKGDLTVQFKSPICYFITNQELSQYVYKNYSVSSPFQYTIRKMYAQLIPDILRPTPFLIRKVKQICGNVPRDKCVGIQIRCGDVFMKTNRGETHSTGLAPHIQTYLNQIRSQLQRDDIIFITSDNEAVYQIACSVFGAKHVLYLNETIQHLDRKKVQGDISKVFVDFYILVKQCRRLYITEQSNYGRVAALCSGLDEVFNVQTTRRMNVNRLISKHERLFST